MEYKRNPNYGKTQCFHCLLSPDGDEPIFIGINRLVAKGLDENKNNPLQHPCPVANRFECPYEKKYQMQILTLKIYLSWLKSLLQ